ncbi:class I SAM-dependent methyltransferase, partial [bacterium]|nr:class I SAM-dependent methyltransferase [bacterium]
MQSTLTKIEKLYNDSLTEHGMKSKGVGWNTSEGQSLRFDKLIELLGNQPESFSVNDLGCGFGSMFEYFESKALNVCNYNGYDISQEMLDSARLRLHDRKDVKL